MFLETAPKLFLVPLLVFSSDFFNSKKQHVIERAFELMNQKDFFMFDYFKSNFVILAKTIRSLILSLL